MAIARCAASLAGLVAAMFVAGAWAGFEGSASARPAAPTATPVPQAPSSTQVHLPALGPTTTDPACRTWIDVQLAGGEPSKVILVVWGPPSACAAPAGPSGVACSGLLGPGGAWAFGTSDLPIPPGARSGALYSFNARGLGEIVDLGGIAIDDVVADYMCEVLFFVTRGDAAEYARFKWQFDTGGEYYGLPQDLAAGSPIVANVRRRCPGPEGSGVFETAANGIPGTAAAIPSAAPGGPFAYGLPHVVAAGGGRSSQVFVQNAGAQCATVEVWFRSAPLDGAAACLSPRRCAAVAVAPGEAARLDVGRACGIVGVAGDLRLVSPEPLAVMVDTVAEALTTDDTASLPRAALAAPLAVDRDAGWRARVDVFNHADVAATAAITLSDAAGVRLVAHDVGLCPQGASGWDIEVPTGTGPFLGWIEVEASATGAADGSPTPRLTGFVTLVGPPRSGANGRPAAARYPVSPAVAAGGAGLEAGASPARAGIVLVPSLVASVVDPVGATSTLVVANTVSAPGSTDLAVVLLDHNGIVDQRCLSLSARTVQVVDLRTWAGLPPVFVGSGVVSATAWRHPVVEPGGGQANPVGLAVLALRSGAALGQADDAELVATAGIAAVSGDIRGLGLWSLFIPGCPGAPRRVTPAPRPTRTPAPTAPPTPPPPTPAWTVRLWLPRVATSRVRR